MTKLPEVASNISTKTFVEEIRLNCQKRFSGELLVIAIGTQWRLHFFMGRLLFGVSEPRVRRWQRLWHQYCPQLSWQELQDFQIRSEPWEYDLLGQAIDRGRITVDQVRQLSQATLNECFVGIIKSKPITLTWSDSKILNRQIYLFSTEQILNQIQTLPQMPLEPELVLRLAKPDQFEQRVSPNVFQALSRTIDGKSSLYQIALRMERPVAMLSRSLESFVSQGWLEPVSAADLPLPDNWRLEAPAVPSKPQPPCVVCIDDSPTMGHVMKNLLPNYKVITVEDPLKAVSVMVRHKPELIFLDLLMPHTNGYELCASLRKTSLFKEIPIIILTGQDGIVDRVRARLVGATEFLAKPPDRLKVTEVISKYLPFPT